MKKRHTKIFSETLSQLLFLIHFVGGKKKAEEQQAMERIINVFFFEIYIKS